MILTFLISNGSSHDRLPRPCNSAVDISAIWAVKRKLSRILSPRHPEDAYLRPCLQRLFLSLLLTTAILARALDVNKLPSSRAIAAVLEMTIDLKDPGRIELLEDRALASGVSGVARYGIQGEQRWHSPQDVKYVQDLLISTVRRHILTRSFREVCALRAPNKRASLSTRQQVKPSIGCAPLASNSRMPRWPTQHSKCSCGEPMKSSISSI